MTDRDKKRLPGQPFFRPAVCAAVLPPLAELPVVLAAAPVRGGVPVVDAVVGDR
jgi:hypothetical protein